MSMDGKGEASFSMVTQEGLFPRDVVAERYSTMDVDVLKGLVGVMCKVWVNGIQ